MGSWETILKNEMKIQRKRKKIKRKKSKIPVQSLKFMLRQTSMELGVFKIKSLKLDSILEDFEVK